MAVPKSIFKVLATKATPSNPYTEKEFDERFDKCTAVFAAMLNEWPIYGLDSCLSKHSKVVDAAGDVTFVPEDLGSKRKALYEQCLGKADLPYDTFCLMLKVLYNSIVNCVQIRAMVSILIGKPRSDECCTQADHETLEKLSTTWDSNLATSTQILYKIANTLKAIGFRDRFPFNVELTPGERYAVCGNAYRQFASWLECDKLRNTNYEVQREYISAEHAKLPADEAESIRKFVDFCIKNKIIKHFDSRVFSYTRDTIIPAVNSGATAISEHFFWAEKDEKREYSLNDSYFKYISENKDLLNKKDGTELLLRAMYMLEANMSHAEHHPNAFFPFASEKDTHRFQYTLGDNYTKHEFITKGEAVPDKTLSETESDKIVKTEYNDGATVQYLTLQIPGFTKDAEAFSFCIHTKDKYHNGAFNPGQYFKDMVMWQSASKNKCAVLIGFKRAGIPVLATIKEPSIVKIDGKYAVRMNMGVINEDEEQVKITEAAKWYLSTGLPAAKNDRSVLTDKERAVKNFSIIKGKTFKFLGIDLGMRTPFSWAVGETTIDGPVNKLKITKIGEYKTTPNEEYYALLDDLKGVSMSIGMTKGLANGKTPNFDNKKIINLIARAKEFFGKFEACNAAKKKTYQRFINSDPLTTLKLVLDRNGNDLVESKKDFDFLPIILFKYVQTRFRALKNARKMHLQTQSIDTKLNQEFVWLKAIELMKRITRSISYLGTDNTRTPVSLDKLTDYFNGCKDNFLKVIASSIVQTAKKNDCSIIVMEELNSNPTAVSLNKRQENFLHALWSPARVKAAIENAANWYGISLAEVSESQTSQVHYESGTYGYRDKTKLYYLDGKEIKSVHADMNAAKNILKKFVTRHASSSIISINGLNDDADADGSKPRLKGTLTHIFGNIDKAIKFFDTKFADDIVTTKDNKKVYPFFYLNGKTWLTKDQKVEYQQSIEAMVKASENAVAKAVATTA